MKTPLRVLFLARFFLSGQTTHFVSLAKALKQCHGIDVGVATTGKMHRQAWKTYASLLEHQGIPTLRADNKEELSSIIRAFQPDIIHTHSSDLLPLTVQLARRLSARSVFTCHGSGVAQKQPAIKDADIVISVGPAGMRELQEMGITRLRLIPNGVDVERFRPENKSSRYQVVYLGRIDEKKRRGLRELIAAVKTLPRIRLIIASNDQPEEQTNVDSVGWLSDPAPLLNGSHAVFGTGRALREGMASGCIAFILGEKYSGPVLPSQSPEDTLPSFSGLDGAVPDRNTLRIDLIRIFQNEIHRHRWAKWGRNVAEKQFDIKDIARRTMLAYSQAGSMP